MHGRGSETKPFPTPSIPDKHSDIFTKTSEVVDYDGLHHGQLQALHQNKPI